MRKKYNQVIITCLILLSTQTINAQTGPFAPAAGQIGSTAIHKDSSIIVSWAQSVVINRGSMDINNPDLGNASYGDDEDATGSWDGSVVSLGDVGLATYNLSTPISDAEGYDFAVFENAFDDNFLELAFVEVSSDGINFFRFENTSLTQDSVQVGAFDQTDPTMIHNLAGKYRIEYGTPFDLSELADVGGLNIYNIVAVRLVDVIGNINGDNISYDSNGNKINEPYPTAFESGGFDLDALGIINQVNAIETMDLSESITISPNPCTDIVNIDLMDGIGYGVDIFDSKGSTVYSTKSQGSNIEINVRDWKSDVYVIAIKTKTKSIFKKVIKN